MNVLDSRLDAVLEGKSFGNLSKLVLLTVVGLGLVVALIVLIVQGMNYDAVLQALMVVAGSVVAGGTASATTYLGKSETRKQLETVRDVALSEASSPTPEIVVGEIVPDTSMIDPGQR